MPNIKFNSKAHDFLIMNKEFNESDKTVLRAYFTKLSEFHVCAHTCTIDVFLDTDDRAAAGLSDAAKQFAKAVARDVVYSHCTHSQKIIDRGRLLAHANRQDFNARDFDVFNADEKQHRLEHRVPCNPLGERGCPEILAHMAMHHHQQPPIEIIVAVLQIMGLLGTNNDSVFVFRK